jgi:hypothetical protein
MWLHYFLKTLLAISAEDFQFLTQQPTAYSLNRFSLAAIT